MALRNVEARIDFKFNPRKAFDITIPASFMEHEPDPERVSGAWQNFCTAVQRQCKCRVDMFQNRRYRKTVFNIGMEKLCASFSRKTESVKVTFELRRGASRKEKTYLIHMVKLNAIPDDIRNARYCTAEIPPSEMQAYAEFVQVDSTILGVPYNPAVQVSVIQDDNVGGDDDGDGDGNDHHIVDDMHIQRGFVARAQTAFGNITGPLAVAVAVDDCPSMVSTIRSFASQQQHQQQCYFSEYENPPVAMAVAEISLTDTSSVSSSGGTQEPRKRSALERMEELDSIKSFLSETEYRYKRQAILNGI